VYRPTTGLRPGKTREHSDIKVLFLDMDGTLLNSSTRLSKKTADACRAAIAKGVKLCIATGKVRLCPF
jgi:hydroxymethylpyrimidine pyrophosphatase-like HAD family hydrolase